MMEFRTFTPAEMAPPVLMHPGMIILPELDGGRHTRVLHEGLRLRAFRHPSGGASRIVDLRGGHQPAAAEDAVIVNLGADQLRGLARRLLELAREIDGRHA